MSSHSDEAWPRISVIIPCFNDAELLDAALASLTTQTRSGAEIIVVDNNSTDASAAVAASYPGVRVVEEPQQGITFATRTGFDAATGDILVRVDADVIAPPDYVDKLASIWRGIGSREGSQGRQVVGISGAARFDLPGWRGDLSSWLYLTAYRWSVGSALGHPPFFGTNFSLRAQWWREHGHTVDYSDPVVHEDLHLSFLVRPFETVEFHPQLRLDMDPRPLYGRRQLQRRFARGVHTMKVNFRHESPRERLSKRWRARHSRGGGGAP